MTAWDRDSPWRQGHVVPDEAVRTLGILSKDVPDDTVVVVVSHDCDLAQLPNAEPNIEVIAGRRIKIVDGNFTHGKNARRLHLTFSGGDERLIVNLVASHKIPVEKAQLAGYLPVDAVRLTAVELTILQRWLAARYRRSAFPDEFDRRLEVTGLRDRLGKILKASGALISAIYFDIDQGEEVQRSGADDPYTLSIYLLYSTEIDPEAAETAADTAKFAIRTAFQEKCISKGSGAWHDIELVECEAISDQAMTVQLAESLKRWSADYISLRTDPPQSMLSNG